MALDTELVRENFFAIAPKVDELTETFYATLFLRYPGVVPLFEDVDMKSQRRMLANALVFTIEHIDNLDEAAQTLKDMGARHVGYGAEPEQYGAVGECLIHALATVSGELWSDALESNWTEAYGAISSIMLQGAEEAAEASTTV